jgi:hypothetical protein
MLKYIKLKYCSQNLHSHSPQIYPSLNIFQLLTFRLQKRGNGKYITTVVNHEICHVDSFLISALDEEEWLGSAVADLILRNKPPSYCKISQETEYKRFWAEL